MNLAVSLMYGLERRSSGRQRFDYYIGFSNISVSGLALMHVLTHTEPYQIPFK